MARPRVRLRRRAPAFVVPLACLLVAGLSELHGQAYLGRQIPDEPRRFEPPKDPPPARLADPPRRAVIAVIDGLREDTFWRQPELAALVGFGAYRRSFVGLPS